MKNGLFGVGKQLLLVVGVGVLLVGCNNQSQNVQSTDIKPQINSMSIMDPGVQGVARQKILAVYNSLTEEEKNRVDYFDIVVMDSDGKVYTNRPNIGIENLMPGSKALPNGKSRTVYRSKSGAEYIPPSDGASVVGKSDIAAQVANYNCVSPAPSGPGVYWRTQTNTGFYVLRGRFALPIAYTFPTSVNDSVNIYMGGRTGFGNELDAGFVFTTNPNNLINGIAGWKMFFTVTTPTLGTQYFLYQENGQTQFFDIPQTLEPSLRVNSTSARIQVLYLQASGYFRTRILDYYPPNLSKWKFTSAGGDQILKRAVSIAHIGSTVDNFVSGSRMSMTWQDTSLGIYNPATGSTTYQQIGPPYIFPTACRWPSSEYPYNTFPYNLFYSNVVITNPIATENVAGPITVTVNTTP